MHVRAPEYSLKAKPFEPFVIRLSSGESVRVDHPDAAIPGTNEALPLEPSSFSRWRPGGEGYNEEQAVAVRARRATEARRGRSRRQPAAADRRRQARGGAGTAGICTNLQGGRYDM